MGNNHHFQLYASVCCWGPFGGAAISTLQTSVAAATSFSPCSYLVNHLTLQVESGTACRALQALQYLAKPVDAVIQATALPIFTLIDHIRSLGRGSCATIFVKVVLTPISLPVKLFFSIFLSAGYLFNGAVQLIIPYSMIYGVIKGREAALRYFYEMSEIGIRHSHVRFIRPIQILPLIHNDDQNPFCKRRNELFSTILPELRDFSNEDNLRFRYSTQNQIRYGAMRDRAAENIPRYGELAHHAYYRNQRDLAVQEQKESNAYFASEHKENFSRIESMSKGHRFFVINSACPCMLDCPSVLDFERPASQQEVIICDCVAPPHPNIK